MRQPENEEVPDHMEHVVTLTMNPSIDISSGVGHVVPDRKLRCGSSLRGPGGGGINVSRAIGVLGGKSYALYPAGGMFGEILDGFMEREDIAHCSIFTEGSTRENITILEESTGRQFRFGMTGPTLREEEWRQCLKVLSFLSPKPAYIVASGSLPPGVPEDFYARVADVSSQLGARLIVDTSGEPLRFALQAGAYLLKPNMREMKDLVGHDIGNEFELEDGARELIGKGGTEAIVVSLGAAAVMSPGTGLCCRGDTERLFRQVVIREHASLKGE